MFDRFTDPRRRSARNTMLFADAPAGRLEPLASLPVVSTADELRDILR